RMYYAANGKSITGTIDMNTSVSHDSKTADANAMEFFNYLKDLDKEGILPDEVVIQSWGVGSGRFDRDFIKKFIGIDQGGSNYSARIKYVLVDNSRSVLETALNALSIYSDKIKIETYVHDLSTGFDLYKGKTHYIRFNELYDDLPAERIKRDSDGKYYRRTVSPSFRLPDEIQLNDGTIISAAEFIRRYFENEQTAGIELIPADIVKKINIGSWDWEQIDLSSEPYGDMIKGWFEESKLDGAVVNTGALSNLMMVMGLLDKEHKGYLQFYDYGDIKPGSASFRFNTDWGQPTFDVDFHFLQYALQKLAKNVGTNVEFQSQYLTNMLKQKVLPRRYVVTTRDDESAGAVGEDLIPDLEIPEKSLWQKLFSGNKPYYPDFSKAQIEKELMQLWQKLRDTGVLWVTEKEIVELPSVRDLPEAFKTELVYNLYSPNKNKRQWGANITNYLFHMKVQLPLLDASEKSVGGVDLNEKYLDLQVKHQGPGLDAAAFLKSADAALIGGIRPVILQIRPTDLADLIGHN
ncbi:MAG: hypothetical protein V2A70_00885, partial [Candidatus Omnitrophota bacterium]